ncbi:MAG: ABC transporter ATP-binding protein [Algicola sp.]|nr:ABC transporter ATP-binding protein [Algicola sp.]
MNELIIHQLEKTYGNGVKALDNVSLTLNNGMFGLLGPNGAGKSSLMRTLATLQTVDGGQILFNDVDCQKDPSAIRRVLGYLPQEFGVYPKTSAVQLLDYLAILKGVENKKARKEQIEKLLKLTNLYQHRNKAVAQYSGGMRQRFGIAQALLGEPKILIIDEPTAGLDPHERNSFHNLLCDISDFMIVMLSTHIVEDINNLCPKMAVLQDGQIRFEGSPKTLIATLDDKLWTKTVAKDELAVIKQNHDVLSTRLMSGQYQVRVVADIQPEPGFNAIAADLEDAYFHVLSAHLNTLED